MVPVLTGRPISEQEIEIWIELSGASSGFQPNQGKNAKFKPIVKIVSYKRCL